MLCNDLGPAQLALFDDPNLIGTFRDVVSMSLRTALSDYQEPMRGLRDPMHDLNALMAFVDGTRCASLLLSYEKALVFPDYCVDAVMQFCDIP
jgi:hypothetical protein